MTKKTRLLPSGLLLSEKQIAQLDAFGRELRRMNQRINLVSSETESEFWKRHTAHCLALATRPFPVGSRIADWGTGGGLPAIPLAIAFPQARIIGVDSVRKKIQSCTAIARRLGLDNCSFVHGRADEIRLEADYSVSRATAPLAMLWSWHVRLGTPPTVSEHESADAQKAWPRGLICLKGGDLTEEIQELNLAFSQADGQDMPKVQTYPLSELFEDPWFEEKMIVQVRSA